jgi:hypothetical protein
MKTFAAGRILLVAAVLWRGHPSRQGVEPKKSKAGDFSPACWKKTCEFAG